MVNKIRENVKYFFGYIFYKKNMQSYIKIKKLIKCFLKLKTNITKKKYIIKVKKLKIYS